MMVWKMYLFLNMVIFDINSLDFCGIKIWESQLLIAATKAGEPPENPANVFQVRHRRGEG